MSTETLAKAPNRRFRRISNTLPALCLGVMVVALFVNVVLRQGSGSGLPALMNMGPALVLNGAIGLITSALIFVRAVPPERHRARRVEAPRMKKSNDLASLVPARAAIQSSCKEPSVIDALPRCSPPGCPGPQAAS